MCLPGTMSKFALLLLGFALLYSEGTEQTGASDVLDPSCPSRKNSAALRGQSCLKACTDDNDCTSSRKCVCDGDCGMSCISPGWKCPWPVRIDNAKVRQAQKPIKFGSVMEVTCLPGFRMAGGQKTARSRCQGDKTWSFTTPCEEVLNSSSVCKPPPEIESGFHEDGPYKIGKEVHYGCNYGYHLEGTNALLCQENQEWSHLPPTCHPVSCPRPANIAAATLVAVNQFQYPVGTQIFYLCKKDYYLEGSNKVVCLENGTWSHIPHCRARCPILAKRSQVIYRGNLLWPHEIPQSLVHHGESVTFFCRSENKTCSFMAASQCFDGVLNLPTCYEEPTYLRYILFPHRLVSEIPAC